MSDALTGSLATALRAARESHELSAGALAERSGVSRAMIGKIERGEAQPTAVLLSRLATALGLTLSELVARAEGGDRGLVRRADQPTWQDPVTGYVRRAVSPPGHGATELVEVELPSGAEAGFPAGSYAFAGHQIWVLSGRLRFHEGEHRHDLAAGDCLRLGRPVDCAYENPGPEPCRYLVVLTKR
ncbi:helix-turn-helix domain-containing protein [Amycolatopsis jiangsuensis]|uniref:Transcriptional regulator with XRE-family HTH domain n=1 Tax=Amycolatopsis jiangsuensis TaxID=1181879 RepID=A0A840ITN7_9PSEU|nr:helix-turn-helix domain-containing protein [Amycolatopsis jiangsuensis]MBB4685816.1 transcriptional regulator with XRE-family HTH domain [Amycolatopsis jiangsuensis]